MIAETVIRAALRDVIDPELGINIVDLGLVYAIRIDGPRVRIDMTMTTWSGSRRGTRIWCPTRGERT